MLSQESTAGRPDVSGRTRVAIVVGALVLAAIVFVAVRPRGDDGSPTATTATSANTPATTAKDAGTVIRVKGKAPAGGVQDITVKQGGTIRFTVLSDEQDHVHLHGYDIEQPVGPQRPARYAVPATINGVFVIELEDAKVQIAQLTVEP